MKKIVLLNIILIMLCLLTACEKKIDVMQNLTLQFDGYNGYGTARLQNEYDWENEAFEAAGIEEIDNFSTLGDALIIESAVSYDIYPEEGLSNGDEVIVKATVNDEAIEEYPIKLLAQEERKFTVTGLPEVQEIDLFENIDMFFQGIAPHVTAALVDTNTDYYTMTHYRVEPKSELNIGDIVTVTVEYDADQLLKNGFVAINDTKEYEVSNVSRYAAQLSDISDDAKENLMKQTEDIIKSDVAKFNDYSLAELTFLGNYFLNSKPNLGNRANYIYYVYQIDLTGSKDFTYYYYIGYYDIIITEDNNCVYDFSHYTTPTGNLISLGWNFFRGFENMDMLFNECVTKNLAEYEYESTVSFDN